MPIKIIRKKKPVRVAPRRGAGRPPPWGKLIRTLGPERIALVDSRLLNGETGEAVAKTIKLEWKLFPEKKLSVLAVQLNDYRRTTLLTKLRYLEDGRNDKALSKFAERVDVLENLTTLVELQQGRVSKALAAEETNHGLHPLTAGVKLEVQTLGTLYKQLSDLQMDLGLLRKVPQRLQIEGGAARAQQALEQAMQRSLRVEQALAQAFDVIDGKFNVVAPDDGKLITH